MGDMADEAMDRAWLEQFDRDPRSPAQRRADYEGGLDDEDRCHKVDAGYYDDVWS